MQRFKVNDLTLELIAGINKFSMTNQSQVQISSKPHIHPLNNLFLFFCFVLYYICRTRFYYGTKMREALFFFFLSFFFSFAVKEYLKKKPKSPPANPDVELHPCLPPHTPAHPPSTHTPPSPPTTCQWHWKSLLWLTSCPGPAPALRHDVMAGFPLGLAPLRALPHLALWPV